MIKLTMIFKNSVPISMIREISNFYSWGHIWGYVKNQASFNSIIKNTC